MITASKIKHIYCVFITALPHSLKLIYQQVKGVFIIAYDQNHGHCSSLKIQPNGAGGMAGKKKMQQGNKR